MGLYRVRKNPRQSSLRVRLFSCRVRRVSYGGYARQTKYQDAYIRAFDKMLEERKRRGKMQGTWRAGTTGRDIFHWWMEDGVLPGQMEFDDLLLEEDEEW